MEEFPIHATVPISPAALERKERASAQHKSQLAGGPPRGPLNWLFRRFARQESFMRAHPPADRAVKETDLFEGIE
jgi:N-acetyl-1-D-myo-inositol-2-amino-2-deoxy-alpha-D-glucopyranoside deacetylase/mycothiol S-conjugate amidase